MAPWKWAKARAALIKFNLPNLWLFVFQFPDILVFLVARSSESSNKLKMGTDFQKVKSVVLHIANLPDLALIPKMGMKCEGR